MSISDPVRWYEVLARLNYWASNPSPLLERLEKCALPLVVVLDHAPDLGRIVQQGQHLADGLGRDFLADRPRTPPV